MFLKDVAKFWQEVKDISGVNSPPVNSISTSEAPVWMYLLSEMAKGHQKQEGMELNEKGIEKFMSKEIEFYPKVLDSLTELRDLSNEEIYKTNNIKIHHFVITAGLQDLVSVIFKRKNSQNLITKIFGCRYNVIQEKNIPIYCMDKTVKTRSLFEIHKGCFEGDALRKVDDFMQPGQEWCPFENMIYIGDGDTDIPSFSLVKSRGGMTIGVYNPDSSEKDTKRKAKNISQRIDLFTPANFNPKKELFHSIKTRCDQIAKRYSARKLEIRKIV